MVIFFPLGHVSNQDQDAVGPVLDLLNGDQ